MQENIPSNLNNHLEKGAKPIMVCVGTFDELEDTLKDFHERTKTNPSTVINVDFFGSASWKNNNFRTDGDGAYVISIVDGSDKMSAGFMNCTGVLVCGADKNTGKNLSFLTHQNPIQLFSCGAEDDFIELLEEQLKEIKERCKPGTIDAVVIGGSLDSGYKDSNGTYKKDYLESLKLLSKEMNKFFGFDPVVINGPKMKASYDEDNFYFLNEDRKAFLVRTEVNQMKDFPAGEGSKIFKTGKKS